MCKDATPNCTETGCRLSMHLLPEMPHACALRSELATGRFCCCADSGHMSSRPPKHPLEHPRAGARHILVYGYIMRSTYHFLRMSRFLSCHLFLEGLRHTNTKIKTIWPKVTLGLKECTTLFEHYVIQCAGSRGSFSPQSDQICD